MSSVFAGYWDVIAFYSLVIILLCVFRKKFEFQGIVALLKTKFGLKFMERTGKRTPKFWNAIGLFSIIFAFIGMVVILSIIFYGVFQLVAEPNAPPVLSPVIPGVPIPGVPIVFPLWYTLFGIFIVVIVHEGSHGIFAAAYNIKIKSSGFAFFGPIAGAFVEPDEKVLSKRPARQQLAILSAGPMSNVVLAIIAFGLSLLVALGSNALVVQEGVTYASLGNQSAAMVAGLPSSGVITAIDGAAVLNPQVMTTDLGKHKPGDNITLTIINETTKNYSLMLGSYPDNPQKAFIGIYNAQSKYHVANANLKWLFDFSLIVGEALLWIFIISLGLALGNLLPIGPVDGGRMFLIALQQAYPDKKAKQIWVAVSFLILVIVLILLFVPIIRAIIK